jgi:hypothetical protein
MVRVHEGSWVYLKTVVARVGVFEQAVHRVKHVMGEEEEPLSEKKLNKEFSIIFEPGNSTIIECLFGLKLKIVMIYI